jgi:hypothetical protein
MPAKSGKSSMWPEYHNQVHAEIRDSGLSYTFNRQDTDRQVIGKPYDTSIIGHFDCNNPNCKSSGWDSIKVAITIRRYLNKKYNAKVWHQRCMSCDRIGELTLDVKSYVDRVAYRLKKWSGLDPDIPVYSGTAKGPHQKKYCEGCKASHCREGDEENRRERDADDLPDMLDAFKWE